MEITLRSAAFAATALLASQSALIAQEKPAPAVPPPDDGPRMEIVLPKIDKLTIGGQYRLRYENRLNYDFDKEATDHKDFFTQRVRLHFGLDLNEQISAFIQFQDVRNWGEEQTTTATSSPGFDVHQGYVQVADFPGVSGTSRIGRQILSYGDQRLIGGLEWLSQGRAFDGLRHSWAEKDCYRIDTFATQTFEDVSTTGTYDDAYFVGAYGTYDYSEDGLVDVYLLYLYGEQVVLDPVAGTKSPDERRGTVGARWQHRFGVLEAEVEGATQFGTVSGADIPIIDTYALHGHLTVHFGGDVQPYVRGEYNAASGNDPNTADNERFNNLFPTAHMHLGMADLALWSNLNSGALRGGFFFQKKSKVELSFWHFRSMEASDSFGGPNGSVSGGVPGGSNEMGNEVDLLVHWDLGTKNVSTALRAGYALFLPGEGAEEANGGADDPAHFLYVQGDFRF